MSINRSKALLTVVLLLVVGSRASAQQTPQVYDNSYAYGNAPYSNPAPANHRPMSPFNPVGFVQDWTPFAPAQISDYDLGPPAKTGVFFSYERMFWSVSRPPVTPVGSPAAEGLVNENGILSLERNTTDTGFMLDKIGWGNRWELGYMDTNDFGWLVSVLDHVAQVQTYNLQNAQVLLNDPNNRLFGFADYNGDGIDDDLNGNSVFGRDGADTGVPPDHIPDTAAPVDAGDQNRLLPRFGTLSVQNITVFNGIEIMRMYRSPRLHDGGYFDLLYGVRFLQIDDKFNLFGTGLRETVLATIPNTGTFPQVGYASPIDDMRIDTRITNNIIGPQVGGRWSHQRGRWIFSAEGRFTAGANFQNGRQRTDVATHVTQFPTNTQATNLTQITDPNSGVTTYDQTPVIGTLPGGNNPAPFNVSPMGGTTTYSHNEFSPVVELRLNTSYQLSQSFALKFGYTGLFVNSVGRAANHVNYTFPLFGFTNPDAQQHIFTNGLNFGVEFNR